MVVPAYDPKSFASLDLRKFHIRDMKDVIRFMEFMVTRMEEAEFVIRKFNTDYSTYKSLAYQLRNQSAKATQPLGAPNVEPVAPDSPVIQSVEDSVNKEHEKLLDEIRQAISNEEEREDETVSWTPTEPLKATYDKYQLVAGKRGHMFFRRDGKKFRMVKHVDVPEDIREILEEQIKNGQVETGE